MPKLTDEEIAFFEKKYGKYLGTDVPNSANPIYQFMNKALHHIPEAVEELENAKTNND